MTVNRNHFNLAVAAFLMLAGTQGLQATMRTTAAAGYWTNTTTWTGGNKPADGDDVTLAHAVTLDESTPALSSFSNSTTLTFYGWETKLNATNIIVNGTITHPFQSDTNGTLGANTNWTREHRVWITCSNLTVLAGKSINVDKLGYQGIKSASGCGPGGGGGGSGGGIGGVGGVSGGTIYGTDYAPDDPGSAGGGAPNDGGKAGGKGGGCVRIQADGVVRVDGSITAAGESGSDVSMHVGGGSGGSIYIDCLALAGTGTISVKGGSANTGGKGGGGGGRLALYYNRDAQLALGQPGVKLKAAAGIPTFPNMGGPGTIYVPDTTFFPGTTLYGGQIVIPSFTNWAPSSLTVIEGPVRLPEPFDLTVSGDILCTNSGGLQIYSVVGTDSVARCNGRLSITNGYVGLFGTTNSRVQLTITGALDARASRIALSPQNDTMTPAGATAYGVGIEAGGDLKLTLTSTVAFVSHGTYGGSSFLSAANVSLESGCNLFADSSGYAPRKGITGLGPGATNTSYSGAGHGGKGAGTGGAGTGGPIYGSSNAPVQPGSSGTGGPNNGGTWAGYGGGAIWVETPGELRIDGTVSANAGAGVNQAGGGSGGSIYFRCSRVAGTSGVIRATGGAGGSGGYGGAGGRIALFCNTDRYSGTAPTVAGAGAGGSGSLVWSVKPRGTAVFVR